MRPIALDRSFAVAFLFVLGACNGSPAQEPAPAVEAAEQGAKPRLGLFTTLPIYWGEADDIGAFLEGESETDWVRAELETRFEIVPLDTLEEEALEGLDRVLLAQPRPLAPSENVAFDAYLADGGRAVIMADPMVTRHSHYPIGDKRRPQDVVLLSPIFDRLGVGLEFDEDQPHGEYRIEQGGIAFPVNLAGRFVEADSGSPARGCHVYDNGIFSLCKNGAGAAFLYADTAVLDWEQEDGVPADRKKAFWAIFDWILAENTTAKES